MTDAQQGSAADLAAATTAAAAASGTYRIAVRHTDTEHPNSAWFAWRRPYVFNPDFHEPGYDALDHARRDLSTAKQEYPARDGYEHRVEQLADSGDKSNWKEV